MPPNDKKNLSKALTGATTRFSTRIFEGEIESVTWKSGIKVAWDKKTVKEPNWKKGEALEDGDGSKRPAVYLVKSKGGKQDVEVEVNITKSHGLSGKGKLLGVLGGLEIEGKCPVSKGTHKVSAKIKELPEEISWYKGDVQWGLEVASASKSYVLKNKTRLEVFVILDKPPGFFKKGTWAEALRFLCDKVGVVGLKDGATAIDSISSYCHSSHGLRYDTDGGRPVYGCGGHGGTFKLDQYIKASLTTVNCYDQAGAVQSLSSALGIPTKWCFQGTPPKIFGFINETDLIGVGKCNNPFYTAVGSSKIVPSTDPRRTSFGNHAFCELSSKMLDACAGPHVGTESGQEYLDASVDYAETTRRGDTAGMAADIVYPGGVKGVS
jgi:hypothetical protein